MFRLVWKCDVCVDVVEPGGDIEEWARLANTINDIADLVGVADL